MRAIVVLLVALLYPAARADAQSLGSLKDGCERLEAFWKQYPPTSNDARIPDDAGGAMCWGYMGAFIQVAGVVTDMNADCSKGRGRPGCWPGLHICYPKGVTPVQILAVFLADARAHPANWHEQANLRYQDAMMAAVPCTGEFPTQNPK